MYMAHSPCFLSLISPCSFPFAPFLTPLYLHGTLLAVTGSVHLGLRSLVNWPPLSPNPSPLQIPRTQVIKRLTMTTSRIQRLLSRTLVSPSPYSALESVRGEPGLPQRRETRVQLEEVITICYLRVINIRSNNDSYKDRAITIRSDKDFY